MAEDDLRPGIEAGAHALGNERFQAALIELEGNPDEAREAQSDPEGWLERHGVSLPDGSTLSVEGVPRTVETEGCLKVTIQSRLVKKLKVVVFIGDC